MDCARNIITANFSGGGTSATTAPLWQWDYGQVLCITGIDLPAAFEVHFSTNKTGGVSTVAVGADGQVTIPNVLLTIGKNLNAWIYLSDAQGEGETEYSITIPVKSRPMPETYDAEVSGEFDDVVRQVSEYSQTAQTAADNAGASASAAATSASEAVASASAAETAKNAAETAQGNAEDAQTAAESAAQTATQKAQQTAQDAAQAALDAGRAESAAGRAEAAQTGAESAKTDAETAAQDAADSASAASASATSAGQAATSAAQSATAAAGSATTAQGAAQTATAKAGEASASASAAAASETAAQTAQTAAETAATNAGQSASTATAKAAEAAQSATDAAASKTAAEAAATRAETAAASLTVDDALSDVSENPVQNKVVTGEFAQVKSHLGAVEIVDTASGAIATFADGSDGVPVKSLTVSLEPIQDLHGQDAPYPAGGGKNMLDYSTADTTSTTTRFYSVSLIANQQYQVTYYGDSNVRIILYDHDTQETIIASSYTKVFSYTPTSDVVVDMQFYNSDGLTSSVNLFQMEKGSTSTPFAPYSNICPISGRQSVTVTRAGVNVWDEELELGAFSTATGVYMGSDVNKRTKNKISVVPGASYYVAAIGAARGSRFGYAFYDASDVFITGDVVNINTALTAPNNARFLAFFVPLSWYTSQPLSVNYPSTDTAYHPGTVASVEVQLGQTVYGGTLDVTKGVLTVDRAMVTYDGSENWYTNVISGGVKYRMSLDSLPSGIKTVTDNDEIPDIVTNILPAISANESWREIDGVSMQTTYGWRIYCEAFNTSDVASWKAFLAEHPLTIAYKLAQPITITLTPEQLTTVLGQNNVWSDGDSVEMTYIADPKLYIARLTEPDADMIADANIVNGQYFMVNNTLYLATANIASGANIVPGVNCTKTNLAAALNAINA